MKRNEKCSGDVHTVYDDDDDVESEGWIAMHLWKSFDISIHTWKFNVVTQLLPFGKILWCNYNTRLF